LQTAALEFQKDLTHSEPNPLRRKDEEFNEFMLVNVVN
jgi:hypothetical protein